MEKWLFGLGAAIEQIVVAVAFEASILNVQSPKTKNTQTFLKIGSKWPNPGVFSVATTPGARAFGSIAATFGTWTC